MYAKFLPTERGIILLLDRCVIVYIILVKLRRWIGFADIYLKTRGGASVLLSYYDCEVKYGNHYQIKKALPFDYYKEIIESYRRIVQTLDIESLQEYILAFPKQNHIWEAIELEVM